MSPEVQHLSDVVEDETYIVSLRLSMNEHSSRREEGCGRAGVLQAILEMMTHAAPEGAPEIALRTATHARRAVEHERESLALLDKFGVAENSPTRTAVHEKLRRLTHDADQDEERARKMMLRLGLWQDLMSRHRAGWGAAGEKLAELEEQLDSDLIDALWPRQKYARRRSPEMSSAAQAIWEIAIGGSGVDGNEGQILMSGMWKMSVRPAGHHL